MSNRISNTVAADKIRDGMEAITSITDYGKKAVPEKPTTEMLAAGSCAGGVSVEAAWNIYRAMLRAAG